jgi:Na+/H+-dicarboxylate symporter
MALFRLKPHWYVVIALLLAVPAGLLTSPETVFLGFRPFAVYDFVGALFLRALKMLVVPLIVSAVINSVSGMGEGVGRLGVRAIVYYLASSLLAVLTGLVLVNVFRPGIVDGAPAKDLIGLSASTGEVLESVSGRTGGDLWGIFLRMIPENPLAAAAGADMLALIVFSILFGLLVARLAPRPREIQAAFWQGVYDIMIGLTRWVMVVAPVGVFALMARAMAQSGLSAFRPLLGFFLVVVAGLAVHMFATLPFLLAVFARVNPWRHFRAVGEALLMAFTTSSSSATLPTTIECMEKAGVPRRVGGFVQPLGATVNMDGTALYECVAALFIAQCYGLELTFGVQFTVVTLALLSSVGVAGIPSASLVAIALILAAVGLPAEGLGLVLAVDRLLDMCRTSVNVCSDTCAAAIVARGVKDDEPG